MKNNAAAITVSAPNHQTTFIPVAETNSEFITEDELKVDIVSANNDYIKGYKPPSHRQMNKRVVSIGYTLLYALKRIAQLEATIKELEKIAALPHPISGSISLQNDRIRILMDKVAALENDRGAK